MLELNIELRKKFEDAAKALRCRLEQRPPKKTLREMILAREIGSFARCHKLEPGELLNMAGQGGIVGVDGSTNSTGGPFPYFLTLQQALAKACDGAKEDVTLIDAYSPLTMKDTMTEDEFREFSKRNLASLEAQAALLALEKFEPRVLLLDGSLVRFKIEADRYWDKLKTQALARNTLLVGVVEGISTGVISDCLENSWSRSANPSSDWEVLFGLMEMGEMLQIAPGLFKEGFRTSFMRSSMDPKPIGIDLIEEQQGYLAEVGNLIFTLTPKEGRGIPLWLDIIDSSVRITDAVMEGLLKAHLGEDYTEFLMPKRKKREI